MAATVITPSAASPALPRAGSRALAKLSNGNWLLVYFTGSAIVSREAATFAGLASAADTTVVADTNAAQDTASYCLLPDGFLFVTVGGGNARFYAYSAGAWTQQPNPSVFAGYSEYHGFKYNGVYYFLNAGNFGSEYDIHRSTDGLTWTVICQETNASGTGAAEDGYGLVGVPWNGNALLLGLDPGNVLQYFAGAHLDGTSTGNWQTATAIETLAAGTPYANNLAGVADSNGNAWIVYNDGTGMQARMLAASGSAWTGKTRLSSGTSDLYPALTADTSGNVWAFWIDGTAGNPIRAQQLTAQGAAISVVGTVQTVESTSATRTNLVTNEADAATSYLVWQEGNSLVAEPFTLGTGGGTGPTYVNGTASASGTATATLSAAVTTPVSFVQGSASAAGSATASLAARVIVQSVPSSASGAASAQLSARVIVQTSASASGSASASLSGAVVGQVGANASGQATATLHATVYEPHSANASGAAQAQLTAVVLVRASASASGAASASMSARVTSGGVGATASGTATATLRATVYRQASANASAGASASLHGATVQEGSASAQGGATASLAATILVRATASASGGASASAKASLTAVEGAVASGTATARLSARVRVFASASAAGEATASAAAHVVGTAVRHITATVTVEDGPSASLTVQAHIEAGVELKAGITAEVTQ